MIGQNSSFKSPFPTNPSNQFNLQQNAPKTDKTDTPARTLFNQVPAESLEKPFA